MADFYQKITEGQGAVEDVIRKIPGFKGYFEKQDRRAADRILREHLVRVFEEEQREFNRIQLMVIQSGGIDKMEQIQRIDTMMRTFIDRIESAAGGYSGVFDAVKIDEEALARVYAFDNALLTYEDQFKTGLSQLEGAIGTETLGSVIQQLEMIVRDANSTILGRAEAMQGLSEAV
jgi:hypothetical protein